MRVKRYIAKDGSGDVKIIADNTEDMWHVYNLIAVGDLVRASTVRKVIRESSSGTVMSDRMTLTLTLEVVGFTYDAKGGTIRISGKNKEENEFVKMNAHHTLELELNHQFTLTKPLWDGQHCERLDEACKPGRDADVAVVLLDSGSALLCSVSEHMTQTLSSVSTPVPKKRPGASGHDKAMERFYVAVFDAIVTHLNLGGLKAVVLAGPGFIREDFRAFLFAEATKRAQKDILENRGKFLLAHCSSANKSALQEVFSDPAVMSQVSSTKAAREVVLMNRFLKVMRTNPDKASYGLKHVTEAAKGGAVDTLLLSDDLFRSPSVSQRRTYVELVETVKSAGGDVVIMSSLHVSGEQLSKLCGVAALLRYSVPLLEEEEEAEADSDSTDSESDEDDAADLFRVGDVGLPRGGAGADA